MSRLAVGLAAALLAAAASAVATAPVSEEAVTAIAGGLRCVVCQNLSVADSPSEMARQMREVIRERLARGDRPDEVRAYFVDKYGEWVLLAPRPRGFGLVVWVLPFVGLVAGALVAVRALRRWSRHPAGAPEPEAATAEDRERVRRELEGLG